MSRAGTPRRRGAATVSVLLGALFALLMCSGAMAAGSAPGPVGRAAAGVATAEAAVADAGAAFVPGHLPAAAVSAAAPAAVSAALAAVGDREVPGCGKSPGEDSGTGSGTPARGSSSYELLHALHDARAASGSWGINDVLPAFTPDPGPPPLDPPSPIDLSVLRV
ncbi:hypothetical protein ABCR94_05020 [Streptomyces sp. 21So2-11]|uniref:hypothetical protein n=1 Tax=Streptomyces sp. 21So2-11 TaxID=3144408 RepID=UPI003219944A